MLEAGGVAVCVEHRGVIPARSAPGTCVRTLAVSTAEVWGGSAALGSRAHHDPLATDLFKCETHITTVNLLQCGQVPGTVPDTGW